MAFYFQKPSHTFSEYLLVPGYSGPDAIPANVSLKTPVVRYRRGADCPLTLNVPMVASPSSTSPSPLRSRRRWSGR